MTLALVVGGLVVLALLPRGERVVPDSTIALSGAAVTLFPQADPKAVWHFASPRVDYDPDTRETVLHDLEDGARTVNGETDFTLASDEVVIGSDENITGDLITAYIPDAAITLTMRSGAGRPVVLDQRQGKFIVPDLYFTGEGLGDNTAKNATMNFDTSNLEADCADETCQNQFIDENARQP